MRSMRSLSRLGATTSAAEPEPDHDTEAMAEGEAAVVAESSPLPCKASSRAAAGSAAAQQAQQAPGGVVRRLSEVHSGHYISLEKLRQQCGSFEEPAGDLLSLLARRVFASRSSLLQRLCSEGQLSDLLAAEDSRQQTPSQHTAASPRSPPPLQAQLPAVRQALQQEGEEARRGEAGLPELQQLPRIRTRPANQGGNSAGSSSAGGSFCVQ
ncbi:hypothetical protein ABPG75_004167 [Micractinium tetrahymenae]